MLTRLRARAEWQLFAVLPRADRRLAVAWWAVVVLRGALPAAFAVAMGVLIGAVQDGRDLIGPLALMGVVFVLLQVLPPCTRSSAPTWAAGSRPGCTTG